MSTKIIDKRNNLWSVGQSRGEKGKESMSTLRRLLARLGTVGTFLGPGVFFGSGLPRKSTSDLDEELRAAFQAWARSSGSGVASSTLRSANKH
jgi:hypothetical protein